MGASATPLGLGGFSVTTLVLSIYNAGIAVGSGGPVNVVLGLTIFYGGLGNLIAGIWEHRAGNTFGATVFTSYGGFWLSYAVILIPGFGVLKAFENDPEAASNAIGVFLLGWAIFTFLVFLCSLRQSVALVMLFAMLDLTFVLLALANFKQTYKKPFTETAGFTGIMASLVGFYMVLATLATEENTFFTLPLGNLTVSHPKPVTEVKNDDSFERYGPPKRRNNSKKESMETSFESC